MLPEIIGAVVRVMISRIVVIVVFTLTSKLEDRGQVGHPLLVLMDKHGMAGGRSYTTGRRLVQEV